MAREKIELDVLVDLLDVEESDYANFFRPMLGYEAFINVYTGLTKEESDLLDEIEAETGFTIPPDLVSFYICTNGGLFGDLTLYPILDDAKDLKNMHTVNVIDKSLKESLEFDDHILLIGEYENQDVYLTCRLNQEGFYTYEMYNAKTKEVLMSFEYLIQLIALEMNYVTDFDEIEQAASDK